MVARAAPAHRWRDRIRPHPAFDVVFAVVTAVLVLPVAVFAAYAQHGYRPMDPLGYALTEAACLALAARRRWPTGTVLACLTLGLIFLGRGYAHGPAQFPVVVALYTVALVRPRRQVILLALAATASLMLVGGIADPHGWVNSSTVGAAGWTVSAIFLGWAVANRRAYIAEIRDRAERAERTREEQARRAVDAERIRIARELHDVISHTMSMIYLQSSAATHVAADHPEQAVAALNTIKAASKEGLRELRAILGVLRPAAGAASGGAPDRTAGGDAGAGAPAEPAPGLDRLDALVTQVGRAGLAVGVSVLGRPCPLPRTVDLAGYRIVQESLTNALRHAGPTRATVRLDHQPGYLVIHVDNEPGPVAVRSGPDGSGTGIVGMRERARALGGTLAAGPRPGGGFRVHARLPLAAGTAGPGTAGGAA